MTYWVWSSDALPARLTLGAPVNVMQDSAASKVLFLFSSFDAAGVCVFNY